MNSLITSPYPKASAERNPSFPIERLRISSLIAEKEKSASLREKGADLLVLYVKVGYTKESYKIINLPKRNDGLDGSAKVSAKVAIFTFFFVWTNR